MVLENTVEPGQWLLQEKNWLQPFCVLKPSLIDAAEMEQLEYEVMGNMEQPQIQPENINIAFDASELLFWNNQKFTNLQKSFRSLDIVIGLLMIRDGTSVTTIKGTEWQKQTWDVIACIACQCRISGDQLII